MLKAQLKFKNQSGGGQRSTQQNGEQTSDQFSYISDNMSAYDA
jgi:hypothetical protein